ncbi:hypothetical protein GCM10010317_006860 [Streptomyces mirabilis]|nr:hypothetical protein GCM10010317_006860 [Streptomyces mirabilis]
MDTQALPVLPTVMTGYSPPPQLASSVEQPVIIARVTQASARPRADRAGPLLITDNGR